VTRIRTREANEGGFDAAKMGRYGGPQGVELRSATDPPGRGRRILAGIVAALLLLAVLGAGGYLLVSRAYFVGDDDGRVAVFRGLAQEPLGVSLHRVELTTDIDTAALPTFRQERLREGIPFPTRREAERYVENDLRRELDDAGQDGGGTAPAPAASPTDPTPRPAQPTQPAPRPNAPAPTATA
jgi:protein phosphatase